MVTGASGALGSRVVSGLVGTGAHVVGVVDAAEATGMRHVVYTSLAGAGDLLSHRLGAPGDRAEIGRFRSDVDGAAQWALRPTARPAAESGVLDLPMGEGAIALVARDDLAEVAVRVAAEAAKGEHANRTYELAGDRALDGTVIAAAIGEAAGRPVRDQAASLGEFRKRLSSAGLLAYQTAHSVSIYANIAAGFLGSTESDLSALLGRESGDALGVIAAAAA